ncbi:MAG: HD domain-containing phosphohydrolase [Oscillospiraceae bacterium]
MKKFLKKSLIVLLCIALNVLGYMFSARLQLPVRLDMIGSLGAAYFAGIWGGIAAVLISSLSVFLIDGVPLFYAIVQIIVVLVYFAFRKHAYAETLPKSVITGFWLGMLCAVSAAPINLLAAGGSTGNLWGDALVDMLRWYNCPNVLAVILGEILVEVIDKQLCVILVCCAAKLVKRFKPELLNATKAASLLLAVGLSVSLFGTVKASAADLLSDNFVLKIYNNTNGMVCSEANTICQTDDGYIWIGSYAGLTRYDGTNFEFIHEGGLVSVRCMMNDSRGRLWIGTNDAGIARYENGEFTFINTASGLSSNSVRCFAEDAEGNIFVGTSGKINKIDENDGISVVADRISFAVSMAMYEGMLAVADNNGKLYLIDGDIIYTAGSTLSDYFFTCVRNTTYGITAGTDNGIVSVICLKDGALQEEKHIRVSSGTITALFEDSSRRLWTGNEKGFGFLLNGTRYYSKSVTGFDSSIDCFFEDYQGNIWVTSKSYGVMKICESRFVDLHEKAGTEPGVVNAMEIWDNDCYIATDNGIVVLDGSALVRKNNKLSKTVGESRVRCLYADSRGDLWVCTYSDNGLIRYCSDHSITKFTAENGTTGNRFRCITELSDGTMAAGTSEGLTFIKGDSVIGTMSGSDGFANSQILSVREIDGKVWAATDGAGIYIIADGKIEKNISSADGLSSDIVLRLVPHDDGVFAVTSNALCHINKDGTIMRLTNFPYFNNYDVQIIGSKAYVTSSAGLISAELSDLCGNAAEGYRTYNANVGLVSGLIANSWNYVSDDGMLFLCTNNGVTVFLGEGDNPVSRLKYSMNSIEYGGKQYPVSDTDSIVVPQNTKQLSAHAVVRNFAMFDAKVRFFVEGVDTNPKTYDWDKIEPIQLTSMDSNTYTVKLQIVNGQDSSVVSEKTYTIMREPQLWEYSWFMIYLIFAGVEAVLAAMISVGDLILATRRREELEKMQIQLEEKVREQTEALVQQQKKTEELFIQTVSALSGAVDAKDRYTSGHSKRVAEYAKMIAARMGKSEEEQQVIYRAGLLHDVGKIRVPVEIINKPGRLTDEEFELIKIHPATGYHILKDISGDSYIAEGSKYHHERYDGRGYPSGLSGEDIPEVARILGVADSYDAMASNRSYRSALPQETVRSEIERGKGTQFDPAIADIMLQMIDEDKDYSMKQTASMRRTILAVDDDLVNLKMIQKIMEDEPLCSIVTADNGADAFVELEKQQIDLVLLDVNLPDADGMELVGQIKEKYHIPVVLMTGDKTLETINKALESGCDDYITKPYQPLLLKEIIHSLADN